MVLQIKRQKQESVLARFILVNANPCELNRSTIRKIIDFFLPLVAGHSFTSFIAIAEDDGTPSDTGKQEMYEWEGELAGHVVRDSIRRVQSVLRDKYAHENSAHKRQPGHKSTVAPVFLVPEKLVIVIGSMPFLATHIELYLERTGVLKERTFDCMRDVMRTVPCSGPTGDEDSFVDVNVREKEFYAGNFNAYIQAVGITAPSIMTTDELMKEFGFEDEADDDAEAEQKVG